MNRTQMIKEIKKLEEFNNWTEEDYERITDTELGAILGLWNIGDGGIKDDN